MHCRSESPQSVSVVGTIVTGLRVWVNWADASGLEMETINLVYIFEKGKKAPEMGQTTLQETKAIQETQAETTLLPDILMRARDVVRSTFPAL